MVRSSVWAIECVCANARERLFSSVSQQILVVLLRWRRNWWMFTSVVVLCSTHSCQFLVEMFINCDRRHLISIITSNFIDFFHFCICLVWYHDTMATNWQRNDGTAKWTQKWNILQNGMCYQIPIWMNVVHIIIPTHLCVDIVVAAGNVSHRMQFLPRRILIHACICRIFVRI